jgi:uncharacterized membrane protein
MSGMSGKVRIAAVLLAALLIAGSVESDVKGVNAVPGELLKFWLTITNDYETPTSVQLSYTAPEGFTGKFLYSGKEVNWIRLDAKESRIIEFWLQVPDDAEEREYTVWVHALSSTTLRINVKMPEELIDITPGFSGIKIEAGEKVTIPVEVKNRVNAELEVDLSCIIPENWTWRFLDGGIEVYRLVLKPGETRQLSLEIEADSQADVGEYTIRPQLNNQMTEILIYITKTHKGEKGKVKLKVVGKDGRAVESAKVKAMGVAEEIFLTSAEGEAVLELPQGVYSIEISKNGYHSKEIEDVGVKAGKTTDLGTVVLEKKPYYSDLVALNPKLSFTIGTGNPTFKLRIENKGYLDDVFRLEVYGLPENFYYRFKESRESVEDISEVFVKSGEAKEVYLEIIVPYNAEPGSYNLTVRADGNYEMEDSITLTLRGEYSLRLEPVGGRYLITGEPGGVVKLRFLLMNSGRGASITNLKVEADAPTGWSASAEPSQIAALMPGDSVMVTLNAVIPPDAIPSEYRLKVKAEGDQTSLQEEFRVVVKEKSNAAIIGGAIILLSLLTLFVIYRRFGRR